MKNVRKAILAGAIITLLGATSLSAFAASGFSTPAEVLAGLTGKTLETVVTEKAETGKTYGTLADDAGKLAEFKAEMIEVKNEQLAEKVAAGVMTQERADEITAAMLVNQENCDGSGAGNGGVRMGAGFGQGSGNGQGAGTGAGQRGQGNMNQGTCGMGNCIQPQ